MIDPDSITDAMRADAERLIDGGQFTIYDAYVSLGAKIIAGDPRLPQSGSGRAPLVAAPEIQPAVVAPTIEQQVVEAKKGMPPPVASADNSSYRKGITVTHWEDLRRS